MNLLLISATSAEIAPLTELIRGSWQQENEWIFSNGHDRITILHTGVGMVATTYALTKILSQQRFDFVIQAGVGGSFDRNIPLGSVVLVTSEFFGDLGAEDHYTFLDVFELGLADLNAAPFDEGKLLMPFTPFHKELALPQVSGLTINMVSGSAFTALARYERYKCTVESMEGAAFHYVCLQENVPFAQIRSISNYVEARNKDNWQMKEAIKNLNAYLISYLKMQ